MSLIYCPECGHEISNTAVACPQCGRPIHAQPVVERKVVVTQSPAQRETFPSWIFIPLGLLALLVIVGGFYLFTRPDDTSNMNVRVASNGRPIEVSRTNVPATAPSSVQTQPVEVHTTTVPGTGTTGVSAPPSDKGVVSITASINAPSGPPHAAKSVRFYLLDKDLESILSEARIDPIEGNTLSGSLGLAMTYPDRFASFRQDAMKAISAHTKYSVTTNDRGVANLANIDPNQYYLFSVTRVGNGFALWNSPVSVVPGQNLLNLSPQDVTEVPAA
ncbi:MAG: zinc-ribbon domain-containing protein [Acidobacteriota bacterium]